MPIENLIISCLTSIHKDYCYLNKTKEEISHEIETSLNELSSEEREKILSSKEELKRYIKNFLADYVLIILKDNSQAFLIINNYINSSLFTGNSSFFIGNNYANSLNQLTKLSNFLTKLNFLPEPDILIKLLEENPILFSNIKEIVDRKIDLISKGKLYNIIQNELIISLIETYCMMNNIEISVNKDNSLDHSSVTNATLSYINEIKQNQELTHEEFDSLIIKAKEGDERAKNKIIESYLNLVVSIAKTYPRNKFSLDDHIQSGTIGLIIAIEKYDLIKGYNFPCYAKNWIRREIYLNIANNDRTIRIPQYKRTQINKFRKAKNKLFEQLGRNPTDKEIAIELGIKENQVRKLAEQEFDTISLNVKVNDESRDELEKLISSSAKTPIEESIDKLLSEDIKALLRLVLSERELEVIMLHHGFINGEIFRLQEIANRYNLTRERIRAIEAKAIEKLRKDPSIKDFAVYMDNPQKAKLFIDVCRKIYLTGKKTTKLYSQEELNDLMDEETSLMPLEQIPSDEDKIDYEKERLKQIELKRTKPKKIKPITEILSVSSDEIFTILPELSESEREIIILQFGKNLDNEKSPPLPRETSVKLYKSIIPKMKKILRKHIEAKKEANPESIQSKSHELNIPLISPTTIDEEPFLPFENQDILETEYQKLSTLFKSNTFKEISENNSFEEALIITIEITGIDISRETIAKILNIPISKVIEITRNILLNYKEESSTKKNQSLCRKRQIS